MVEGDDGGAADSVLKCAISPSGGAVGSRFCGPFGIVSCCDGLLSCGGDGVGDALVCQDVTDFVAFEVIIVRL